MYDIPRLDSSGHVCTSSLARLGRTLSSVFARDLDYDGIFSFRTIWPCSYLTLVWDGWRSLGQRVTLCKLRSDDWIDYLNAGKDLWIAFSMHSKDNAGTQQREGMIAMPREQRRRRDETEGMDAASLAEETSPKLASKALCRRGNVTFAFTTSIYTLRSSDWSVWNTTKKNRIQ